MIRWGFYGVGTIANKLANDFKVVQSGEVIAAFGRNDVKVNEFCHKYGIVKPYTDEGDFFNDKEIDVIYVAVPHALHFDVVKKALSSGKAVVCEKPFALNYPTALEAIECARRNNLFLMEGLWSLFLPAINESKARIMSGEIGKVHTLECSFGFESQASSDSRLMDPKLGGGALLDVGIYTLLMCWHYFGELPELETVDGILTETGVDGQVVVTGHLPKSGVKVNLKASILEDLENALVLIGGKGNCVIPNFWEATTFSLNKETTDLYNEPTEGLWGYHYEIEHVNHCIREKLSESEIASHSVTLKLAEKMDEIRSKIGVVYDVD